MAENTIKNNLEKLLNEIEFAETKKEIKFSFNSLIQIINDNENFKKFFDKNVKDFILIKEKNINEYNEILKYYSNCIKELKLADIPIYYGLDFEFIDFVDFIYKTNENYNFDYSNGIFRLYDSLIYNLFCNTLSRYPILQENLRPIYNNIINSYSYYYLNKRYENQMSKNDRMGYYILIKTACIDVLQELLKYIKKNNLLKKEKQEQDEYSLTIREQEVVNYLKKEYLSYKELAKKMKISERGVKSHIDNIASKFQVKGIKGIREKLKK